MSLKITFLKAFFNLNKNNETNIYKENTEHREALAKTARVLKDTSDQVDIFSVKL